MLVRVSLRLPWLLIPLVGGLLVAVIQAHFEQQFSHELLLLMLFTPAVIGLSGGVGLQSSTVVVRGIATGEIDLRRVAPVALKELAVGCTIALAVGLLSSLAVWGLVHSGLLDASGATGTVEPSRVAIAVTLGLIAGMCMGTATGTFIPLLCHRIGVDPAFVAGPFTTTMNDVVGTTCYIVLALLVLRF